MKVLVVGTGGALQGSGITTMADQLTRTLAEMGHEPTRLVAGDRRRAHPNRLNLENVLAVLREALSVARAARRARVDLVWLHTFGVPTLPAIRTLLQVVACRLVGRPVIVHFHAFSLAAQVAAGGHVQRMVLRLLGKLSQRLIALQDDDTAALRAVTPDTEVVTLPNWVEVPPEASPLPEGPPYVVVFVGSVGARKGVPELVAAVRLMPDVPLELRIVGGPGDEGAQVAASIRGRASDLVGEGRVLFTGHLDRAAIRRQLEHAHLFVLPARAEGAPVALLEAMAVGRPVLVSGAGNMADVVRGASCGALLESTEPAELASGLRSAIGCPDALIGNGLRAHSAALQHWSQKRAAADLTALLRTPATKRRRR